MKFTTRHFGVLEIEEDKIISFPSGIIGFPRHNKFCLVNRPESLPYFWLQCVDQPEWAFVVLPIPVFKDDYQFRLSPAEIELLKFVNEDIPLILSVVVIPPDINQATVNLLAPIVINERERMGTQIINENGLYRARHLLKEEIKPVAKEGEDHAGADKKEKAVCDSRR
jgi:flagellar assembly factor FliW